MPFNWMMPKKKILDLYILKKKRKREVFFHKVGLLSPCFYET